MRRFSWRCFNRSAAHLIEQNVRCIRRGKTVHLLWLRIGHQIIVELEPILRLICCKGEVVTRIHAVAGVHNTSVQIIVYYVGLLQGFTGAHLDNDLETEAEINLNRIVL